MRKRRQSVPVEVTALDVTQVAQSIGIGESTVFRMWADGSLPFVLICGMRRTTRADLDQWLANLPRQTQAIDQVERELVTERLQ